MAYKNVQPPAGEKISVQNGKVRCPNHPIIPFIRGDGTGPDIWAASERVFNAAVEKAYKGSRKIAWFEVFAGETAKNRFDDWLPEDTVTAFKEYLVGNCLTSTFACGRFNISKVSPPRYAARKQ
jgi:isocitrate dehydrogenase